MIVIVPPILTFPLSLLRRSSSGCEGRKGGRDSKERASPFSPSPLTGEGQGGGEGLRMIPRLRRFSREARVRTRNVGRLKNRHDEMYNPTGVRFSGFPPSMSCELPFPLSRLPTPPRRILLRLSAVPRSRPSWSSHVTEARPLVSSLGISEFRPLGHGVSLAVGHGWCTFPMFHVEEITPG